MTWGLLARPEFLPADFFSDMGGTCPNGEVPPDCYPGAKWAPNDPLFFLHHTVRVLSGPFSHLLTCAL